MRTDIKVILAAWACLAISGTAAAALPAAISEPITLPGAVPAKFTRNVFAGDKVRKRVFVPSYRVAFMMAAGATATTVDTRASASTRLVGVDPELLQAIADRAHQDMVDRLVAAGFEVVPQAEWRAAPGATDLKQGSAGIEVKSAENLGATQIYALVHPTGLGSWPESSMPVNLGAVRRMTGALDATMVAPRFTVNFAYVIAKGASKMSLLGRGAQASLTPGIHGGPLIAGLGLEAWRVRVGQHGGFMEYRQDNVLPVTGSFDQANSSGTKSVDTWDSRLYGPSQLSASATYEANPEAYAKLALQALALQNQVAVDELAKARK